MEKQKDYNVQRNGGGRFSQLMLTSFFLSKWLLLNIILKDFYFTFLLCAYGVCVWSSVPVSAGALGGQKRAADPLELELRPLWSALWEFRELNSDPLQEHYLHLIAEPSP